MIIKGSKIKSLKRRYGSSRYVLRELKQRRRRRQREGQNTIGLYNKRDKV